MEKRLPVENYLEESVELLKKMVGIPSVTFEEDGVAGLVCSYLKEKSGNGGARFEVVRIGNNIAAIPCSYNRERPTLLLNAHIDTVKPAESYTCDPFGAIERDGAIYGLGSNDDGGSVVSLTSAFLHFMEGDGRFSERFNLLLLLSAEEERSGANGILLAVDELKKMGYNCTFAIVGEPTGMKAAIAERGLLVIDAEAIGVSGHAARNEGVNALYKAIDDISKIRAYKFEKRSSLMGDIKVTVTQINGGTAHNVVPDRCGYVIDIRPTEIYSNREILDLLQSQVESRLVARNLKNRSSATPQNHILMRAVEELGIEKFISPTTSDWMKLEIPAIKIGPGESARSHKADEYIKIDEIREGIAGYITLINKILDLI